jgi:general secretion pathway protein E
MLLSNKDSKKKLEKNLSNKEKVVLSEETSSSDLVDGSVPEHTSNVEKDMKDSEAVVAPSGEDSSEKEESIDMDLDSSDQLRLLFKSHIKILTADGEFLHRPSEQQEIMALYENGIFLVSKSHIHDPYVLKLEAYARLRDIRIRKKIPVSLEVIRDAYKHFSVNLSLSNSSDRDLTKMQKDIVDLIQHAADNQVSDIHVISSNVSSIVEMRRNGVLHQEIEWQAAYGQDFCAACFAMADASDSNYNPTEYQAARISSLTVELPMSVQALRLQFNPLAYGGRYMIARLLYNSAAKDKNTGVGHLGYHKYQTELLEKMSKKPVGICIISGPTGSGKSTTLFHMLDKVMADCKHERNVLTIEDPPERPIDGAKQMPVTNAPTPEERDIKFVQAISAAMRSDPDTIMIGEVRDASSAGLAIKSAMTGHQVWTTVHANDALMILNRLRDIGVPSYNLYTSGLIFGLVAQRLSRKLCEKCRIPYNEAVENGLVDEKLQGRVAAALGDRAKDLFVAGEGCDVCGDGKGFTGRTVIAEIIAPDDKFMDLMKSDNLIDAKKYWIENLKGMTMMIHGLLKALNGEIPPSEVERVVGAIELDENTKLEDYE